MNQMLAKKADVDRIYLPCQEGGRSLKNLEKGYKVTKIGLQTYMTNKNDVQIQAVLRHQNSKAFHSVPKDVRNTFMRLAQQLCHMARQPHIRPNS